MSRATDEGKIKAERTAQRKQAKRQRKADEASKREKILLEQASKALHNAGISLFGKHTESDREKTEEAKRERNRQLDELANELKAKIEAERAAGREPDIWEWIKDAPCAITKALRERGISFGKRKR